MRGVLLAVLVALSGPAVAAQELSWRFTEVLRFSEAPPDIAFGMVAAIQVHPDGRFFVFDQLNSAIFVFAPDGAWQRTIGRRGAGPGELSRQAFHMTLAGEELAVFDMGNQRVTRFGLEGERLGEFRVAMMEGPVMGLGGLPDGSLLLHRTPMPFPPGRAGQVSGPSAPVLLRLATDGTVLDTVMVFRHQPSVEFSASGQMTMRMPDMQPVWGMDGEGGVVVGHSDRYALQTWQNGQLGPVWGRDVAREPVTRALRERMQRTRDSMMARMPNMPNVNSEMEFPDSLPVMWDVEAGPFGTTLVGRVVTLGDTDRQESPWDVFDAVGRYQGLAALPARFRLMAALGDRLYGVALDEDDVPWVVIYRVTR